jgi:isoleucyl-tRNA synthetase
MPVAQQHYPFENQDKFEASFPADYIGEGLDQTRLWFYVQHVISTILFDKPAYKNVLVNGMIMAADGQKLSKRLKNYPPVEDVFAQEGADTLRLYLLSNNQAVNADYMRFNRDGMKDLNRNVLGTLQNSYRFFKMYADIDNFVPKGLEYPQSTNMLDKWILSRLEETVAEVTKNADDYKLAHAINPIFVLIDDTSNWFIRRSRRRFWKSEDDTDKNQAYHTLWYVLVRICQLLAPWAPFLSDHLWRKLTEGTDLPASVHLSDWPEAGEVDRELLQEMQHVRNAINEGLKLRAEAKIKVRQPLSKAVVWDTFNAEKPAEFNDELLQIIADELNVKEVKMDTDGGRNVKQVANGNVELDTELTPELKAEGLMRDIVRHAQNARKSAGLNVEDRIVLSLQSDDADLQHAVAAHGDIIKAETLANELTHDTYDFATEAKIEGEVLTISLKKA